MAEWIKGALKMEKAAEKYKHQDIRKWFTRQIETQKTKLNEHACEN